MSRPLTYDQATARARELWSGIYLTALEHRGFSVRLHGPTGPVHLLDDAGNVVCRCCADPCLLVCPCPTDHHVGDHFAGHCPCPEHRS